MMLLNLVSAIVFVCRVGLSKKIFVRFFWLRTLAYHNLRRQRVDMQTRSHTRGEHIPFLPFEVWAIVLNFFCKSMDEFPERCRLQSVCRAFRMDAYTFLPGGGKVLSLQNNVRKGYLNAMVICKHAFANIMELNLHDSLMSGEDQLALSAVSWPHLSTLILSDSGIFDRPCALFLKKWHQTIITTSPVIIDIASNGIDLFTTHYCCQWMQDSRLQSIRMVGPKIYGDYRLAYLPYLDFFNYLSEEMSVSPTLNDCIQFWTCGFLSFPYWLYVEKARVGFYILPTCPMERKTRVICTLGRRRKSGRPKSNVSLTIHY